MKLWGKIALGAGFSVSMLVLLVAILAMVGAFYGWLIMLAFGIVHGSVADAVPAAGFLPCWALGLIGALLTGGSSD